MAKMSIWNIAFIAMAFRLAFARPTSSSLTRKTLDESVKFTPRETYPCLRSQCRFELCGKEKRLILGERSLNPQAICLRGKQIGKILGTGTPIRRSPYNDYGQPCCADFEEFQGSFKIVSLPFGTRASGIEMNGSLAGRDPDEMACFRVPVLKYEKVTKKGKVRVVRTNNPKDCLSFYAFRPDIVVETEWFSPDKLGMSVRADGYIISEPKTFNQCDAGVLSSSRGVCGDSSKSGLSRLFAHTSCNDFLYGSNYKLRLRHVTNCGQGATKWKLERYTLSGYPLRYSLQETLEGTSNKTSGEIIAKTSFTD